MSSHKDYVSFSILLFSEVMVRHYYCMAILSFNLVLAYIQVLLF